MTVWNQIINAAYRDEWHLIDVLLGYESDHDDAVDVARHLGFICAERLRKDDHAQLPVVITWLMRQPYLHRATFAEWVLCAALKQYTEMHLKAVEMVKPACRPAQLLEIQQHIYECQTPRNELNSPG